MKNPNILVTIAARGGSKGVKNKNIRLLAGKPLIDHTVRQALAWGRASRVVVSTDSKAIADCARRCGAQVPFLRPARLATDACGKVPVIRHALLSCEQIYGTRFDIVVDLDVTAPIRTLADLDDCLRMFVKHKPTTIFSVVEAHKNPYFNMVEKTPGGKVVVCKTLKKGIVRRQDAPAVYDANASIYFYDRDYLMKAKAPKVINDRCMIYVMPEIAGVDIDREIDFQFIEFLIKGRRVRL